MATSTASSPLTKPIRPPLATLQVELLPLWSTSVATWADSFDGGLGLINNHFGLGLERAHEQGGYEKMFQHSHTGLCFDGCLQGSNNYSHRDAMTPPSIED